MLPFEEENRKSVRALYGPHFELASDFLNTGTRLLKRFDESHLPIHPKTQVILHQIVIMTLYRYRSILMMAEFGHIHEVEVLMRSLFDLYLSLHFICVPTAQKATWSTNLKGQYATINSMNPGNVLVEAGQIDFRARLYVDADSIKHKKMAEKIALASCSSAFPVASTKRMEQIVSEIEADIGKDWVERIRNTNSFTGIKGIDCLAEYADQLDYYLMIYGVQSGTVHGGGISLVGPGDINRMSQSLTLAVAFFGMVLDRIQEIAQSDLADEIASYSGKVYKSLPGS